MKRILLPAISAAVAFVGMSPAPGPGQAGEVAGAYRRRLDRGDVPAAAGGKQLGYFKDEGIEVTIAAFSGGSKALEALLGGSTDMVAGAYSNTLTMAAKGQRLVMFAAQVNCPAWIFGLAKKNEGKVTSIKDLKGMRIGVSAPGSSTHMVVNYMLIRRG